MPLTATCLLRLATFPIHRPGNTCVIVGQLAQSQERQHRIFRCLTNTLFPLALQFVSAFENMSLWADVQFLCSLNIVDHGLC